MAERSDRAGLGLHPVRHDEWHFDKHIWQPLGDPTDHLPTGLSTRGAELEAAIGKLELERHFAAVRRDIRAFIAECEAGRDVEALVEDLLS